MFVNLLYFFLFFYLSSKIKIIETTFKVSIRKFIAESHVYLCVICVGVLFDFLRAFFRKVYFDLLQKYVCIIMLRKRKVTIKIIIKIITYIIRINHREKVMFVLLHIRSTRNSLTSIRIKLSVAVRAINCAFRAAIISCFYIKKYIELNKS